MTPELYERQRLGPYCASMQESSDRAQHTAATLEKAVDNTVSELVKFRPKIPPSNADSCDNVARCEPILMKEAKPTTLMSGGAPGRISRVWLWCGGHTEVGRYLGSTRNGVTDLG